MENPEKFKAARQRLKRGLNGARVVGLVLALVLGPGNNMAAPEPAQSKLTEGFLYFRDSAGMHLRAVSKWFPSGLEPHELGLALLEAVMAGPPAKDLGAIFPEGARVEGLFITSGGDAYVDMVLPKGRLPGADTMTELLGIYSLVNTLTLTLPEINRVKFLVNGIENSSLGGHVSLAPFFKTNMVIVK